MEFGPSLWPFSSYQGQPFQDILPAFHESQPLLPTRGQNLLATESKTRPRTPDECFTVGYFYCNLKSLP